MCSQIHFQNHKVRNIIICIFMSKCLVESIYMNVNSISCSKNHKCCKKKKLTELVLHTYNIRMTWLYELAYPQQICINGILHYSINGFIKIFLNILYEYIMLCETFWNFINAVMSMRLDYLCYIGKVKNRTEKTYIYINYPSIYIYIYIYTHLYICIYIL